MQSGLLHVHKSTTGAASGKQPLHRDSPCNATKLALQLRWPVMHRFFHHQPLGSVRRAHAVAEGQCAGQGMRQCVGWQSHLIGGVMRGGVAISTHDCDSDSWWMYCKVVGSIHTCIAHIAAPSISRPRMGFSASSSATTAAMMLGQHLTGMPNVRSWFHA